MVCPRLAKTELHANRRRGRACLSAKPFQKSKLSQAHQKPKAAKR